MKNIKKIATLLAVLLVAMSLLIAMSSCGGSDEEPDDSTQSSVDGTDNSTGAGSSSNGTGSTDNSTGTGDSTPNSKPGSDTTDEENPNLVKVTVLNQLGKPVKNAYVQICQGEVCFSKPIVTGNDGFGSREYTLGEGELKAKILSVDDLGEEFIASGEYIYFDEGSRELTIYIQKVVVNVFDDKENAIDGAQVQLYQGESALEGLITTDADGVAYAFIAVNDELALSAKVTEILSGDSYVISKDATYFEDGEYYTTIVVKKNSSYAVRVSTLTGEPVAGAQVKLFLDGFLEDVATTNASGLATFDNLPEGEYSVEVSTISPAYQIIGGNEEDGRHYFSNGATSLEVTALTINEITYTVNTSNKKSGQTIYVFDIDNVVIAEIGTNDDGVAVFTAPNGYYTAILITDGNYAEPAYFVKDDDAVGEINVTDKVAGSSKDAPIFITGEINVSITADGPVWFAIPNGDKKVVTIEAPNGGIGVGLENDNEFSCPEDETVINVGSFLAEKGKSVVFYVTSSQAQAITVSASAPGTRNEPFDLSGELSANAYNTTISLESEKSLYYKYVADADGTICVTVPSGVTVLFNEFDEGLDLGDGRYLFSALADEEVLISFESYETVDAHVSLAFGEVKIDYTIGVYLGGENGNGVAVILYTKNGDELVEIARKTADENGQCVFEDMPFANNYVVKVECPDGYECFEEEFAFDNYNYVACFLSKIKTGEADAPFDFDTTDELKETVSVPENGTVWYTLYVRPSQTSKYYIVAKSENAVVKVYNADTNGDGIINEEDTPIGVSVTMNGESSYVFGANNMLYTIAVSTVDGSAEELEIEYKSQELPAGTTEDNAIEITESGEYVASVNGMVYYVYTGNESCKLTVTLTGEASLKQLMVSMSGSTLVDLENNTLVIEDTMGSWIYFAIASDNPGEYEFTVTIE